MIILHLTQQQKKIKKAQNKRSTVKKEPTYFLSLDDRKVIEHVIEMDKASDLSSKKMKNKKQDNCKNFIFNSEFLLRIFNFDLHFVGKLVLKYVKYHLRANLMNENIEIKE